MRIVYHSFQGRFSDSPRALYEALRLLGDPHHDHVWLIDERHRSWFPADLKTVRYGTGAAVEVLEAADLVIANGYTGLEWKKAPGATYLQTWHGTPLKRIGWDARGAIFDPADPRARDVCRWDILLSANPFASDVLRRAFRFEGEVLESGYPRNDVLRGPHRSRQRERIRHALDIADQRTVVLYAPTWRAQYAPIWDENGVSIGGASDVELGMDLDVVCEELGRDYTLLLRLHYLLTGRRSTLGSPAIRDVSWHPEISDLYLAADALVTDYSSTMFDFALTGRPQILFAYDLDDYRDRERGFYLDLEQAAPGPVVRTTTELIAELRDLSALTARSAARYARFQATFCSADDGHATDRVLKRLGLLRLDTPRQLL